MSERKHTPGPWRVYSSDLRGGRYWTVHIEGVDENGEAFEAIDIHELDNGEANARLIAAAPEMLEALQTFIDQWNACGPNSDFGRYFRNVRDKANAALARARDEATEGEDHG